MRIFLDRQASCRKKPASQGKKIGVIKKLVTIKCEVEVKYFDRPEENSLNHHAITVTTANMSIMYVLKLACQDFCQRPQLVDSVNTFLTSTFIFFVGLTLVSNSKVRLETTASNLSQFQEAGH